MEDGPVRASGSLPYVVAVLVMSMVGVAAIVGVTIVRPDKDNSTIIASLIGFLTPTTMALLAFMKSQETHKAVNGRLEAFIQAAESMGRLHGIEEERYTRDIESTGRLHGIEEERDRRRSDTGAQKTSGLDLDI